MKNEDATLQFAFKNLILENYVFAAPRKKIKKGK